MREKELDRVLVALSDAPARASKSWKKRPRSVARALSRSFFERRKKRDGDDRNNRTFRTHDEFFTFGHPNESSKRERPFFFLLRRRRRCSEAF